MGTESSKSSTAGSKPPSNAGLCGDCIYRKIIVSDRGSVFLQCERAFTDPGFPKYPRLPVVMCGGYERES